MLCQVPLAPNLLKCESLSQAEAVAVVVAGV